MIDVEEAALGSVGLDVYIRYFKSIGLAFCFSVILSSAANQGAAVYGGSKSEA